MAECRRLPHGNRLRIPVTLAKAAAVSAHRRLGRLESESLGLARLLCQVRGMRTIRLLHFGPFWMAQV